MIGRILLRGWIASLMVCAAQVVAAQNTTNSGSEFLDLFNTLHSTTSASASAPTPEQVAQEVVPLPTSRDKPVEQKVEVPQNTEDLRYLSARLETSQPVHQTASVGKQCGDIVSCGNSVGGSSKKKKALAKAVAGSHKVVHWNNNFDYLSDPYYDDYHLGDGLKRLSLGNNSMLDIGGSYRLRYHNERNMRGLGLTGRDDDFLLQQTRLYANLELGDRLRLYGEMIDAVSDGEAFNPRPIEEDRADFLNLFVDFKFFEGYRGDLSARVGRQELIYGDQRLVSPLPWGNTRRTFEGGKLQWKGKDWDADAFWTRPVSNETTHFNSPDQSREFMGLYSTYKGFEKETVDLYFLRFLETDGSGFEYNTFGTRMLGSLDKWLWEAEVAGQFGNVGTASQSAWAYTFGLGRKFPEIFWQPTFWAYYDFASGDDNGNGFNHLFPLSHKYLGFMDLFGRRNIEDLNFKLTASPTKKLQLLMWWHIFNLQNTNDVPYNVNMTPFVATAGGSADLGQELDLTAKYKITPRTNVLLGYSHFFAGDFYTTNPTPPPSTGDADFYYVQYSVNF